MRLSIIVPYKSQTVYLNKIVDVLLPQLSKNDCLILADFGKTNFRPKQKLSNQFKHIRVSGTESNILNHIIQRVIPHEYIAIVDFSCIPTDNYVEECKKAIKKNTYHIIFGMIADGGKGMVNTRIKTPKELSPLLCRMSNFIFPREAALKAGLFPPGFKETNSFSHGIAFCFSLRNLAGCNVVYDSNIRVVRKTNSSAFRRSNREKEQLSAFSKRLITEKYHYKKDLEKKAMPISLIISNSKDQNLVDMVKTMLSAKDEVVMLNSERISPGKQLDNIVTSLKNECVIIISPKSTDAAISYIPLFKNNFDTDKILIGQSADIDFNYTDDPDETHIRNDTCICFSKKIYYKGMMTKGHTYQKSLQNFVKEARARLQIARLSEKIIKDIVKEASQEAIINRRKRRKVIPKRKPVDLWVLDYGDQSGIEDLTSIIIPYSHHPSRYSLLLKTLDSLPDPARDNNIEICIVETGPEQFILDLPSEYKYLFVKTPENEPFHRAWALNIGVRILSRGEKIVLADADILYNNKWMEEVKDCNHPAAAWGKLLCLTEGNTRTYLETGILGRNFEKVKTPSLRGAAGGATIIPREVFYKIGGVPEDFKGTRGGPDNALMAKLAKYGYPFDWIDATLIHMWHPTTVPINREIKAKIHEMLGWDGKMWESHIREIGNNWGKVNTIAENEYDNWLEDYNSETVANFYWTGNDFQFLNRLCIISHIEVGHRVIIWVDGDTPDSKYWIDDIPDIEFRDAKEVFDTEEFIKNGGNPRTASTLWSFQFLNQYGGLYCDCDAIAVKSFPKQPWIIATCRDEEISVGVIKVPRPGHPMFQYCIDNIKKDWGNVWVFTEACKKFGIKLTNPHSDFYPYMYGEKSWTNLLRAEPIWDCYSIHFYGNKTSRAGITEKWLDEYPDSRLAQLCRRFFTEYPYVNPDRS